VFRVAPGADSRQRGDGVGELAIAVPPGFQVTDATAGYERKPLVTGAVKWLFFINVDQ
jgi:hypothetical protein